MSDQAVPLARFRPVPWTELNTPQDVEEWVEAHNLALQEHIRPNESGYGICFSLREGGNIYMQTSPDGAIVLDVDGEADWVSPLIAAAAQAEPPVSSLWVLPDDKLIQLVIGLSSLVESTTLVVGHPFGLKQRYRR
jgi:hypothetical protein